MDTSHKSSIDTKKLIPITQALQNINLEEYALWQAYRSKVGSLNAATRQEIMLAQLCAITANAHGAQDIDIYDFAPSLERPKMEFGEALVAMRKT